MMFEVWLTFTALCLIRTLSSAGLFSWRTSLWFALLRWHCQAEPRGTFVDVSAKEIREWPELARGHSLRQVQFIGC